MVSEPPQQNSYILPLATPGPVALLSDQGVGVIKECGVQKVTQLQKQKRQVECIDGENLEIKRE